MEFSDWLTKKYIEWRGDAISGKSVSAFAREIGTSQALMSEWLSGKKKPGRRSLIKLGEYYPEVYEILGFPNPEPDSPFSQLPAPFKERLEAAMSEINTRYQDEGVNPDNDSDGVKALEIAREVFDKFGIDINITDVDDEGS